MKSYSGFFNELAGQVSHVLTEEMDKTTPFTASSSDVVDDIHRHLGIKKTEMPPATETVTEEHNSRQLENQQQAAAAGDTSVLAGAQETGVAAQGSARNAEGERTKDKKRNETQRLLNHLMMLRNDLTDRINDLDEQYARAMQDAQEHFELALEADTLANKIENGTATPEEIERAREILGKDAEATLDPQSWTEGLREIRDIQDKFGLEDAEKAQAIRDKAEHFRRERDALDKTTKEAGQLPPEQAEVKLRTGIERAEALDLSADALNEAPSIQNTVDVSSNDLSENSIDDAFEEEFEGEVTLPSPSDLS